jgi:Ras and EF-hand domain-containing protein
MDQKAADLFAICDKEDKGFVTKRDMQRMLNLDDGIFGCMEPDQLESVFDALDSDGNGYLTLEEFSEGFQHFNGVPDGPESLTESGIVEVSTK